MENQQKISSIIIFWDLNIYKIELNFVNKEIRVCNFIIYKNEFVFNKFDFDVII